MANLNNRFPIYSKFLKLYPPDYRKLYTEEMLQTTADILDDASGVAERSKVWAKLAVDVPVNILRQQLIYSGGVMKREMPNYIKINGLISGLLLVPFFLALVANGADKLLKNHNLYNSWLWSSPVLKTWVLELPTIAALLAIATFIFYLAKAKGGKQDNWQHRALDIRRDWPIVLIGLLAVGILFLLRYHDSFACWVQVPAHDIFRSSVTQLCQSYKLF